jgi:hypothetical protein
MSRFQIPQALVPASFGTNLISRTSFSGSTSAIFDSVFTSTYDSYMIIIEDVAAVTGADDLLFQFRYGTTTQASGYYGTCGVLARGSTTWGNLGSVNAASLTIVVDIGGVTTGQSATTLFINQVGDSSQRASIRGTSFNGSNADVSVIAGVSDTPQTFTGFRISAGSNINGTVAIYGIGK